MSDQPVEAETNQSLLARFGPSARYSSAVQRGQKSIEISSSTPSSSPSQTLHDAIAGPRHPSKTVISALAGGLKNTDEAGSETLCVCANGDGAGVQSKVCFPAVDSGYRLGANGGSIAPPPTHSGSFRDAPAPFTLVGSAVTGTGAADVRPVGGFLKRLFDIVVAGTALLLLAPLIVAVYVLIRIRMGGPAIFVQQRVGFGGVLFDFYKFRTMRRDAEQTLEDHLLSHPVAAREWRENRKLKNDPRVTPIGRLLRKTSIDDLPQLWNVLRGDMSCVGPRPVMADEIPRYGEIGTAVLVSAKPGLTGLWQVSGRNSLSYQRRVELDCQYVTTWSLGLDLEIVARTLPALLEVDSTS